MVEVVGLSGHIGLRMGAKFRSWVAPNPCISFKLYTEKDLNRDL